MGVVHRATDRTTGEQVAVKVMLGEDAASPGARRFAAEIGVLSRLSHPAIVGYVAHGEAPDGRPYLAMELLEGEELSARLLRGPLPLQAALVLVRRVASALGQAHALGVVHRDLKPSNLFLRGGRVEGVTLLDFGIARRSGLGEGLTRTGKVVGTPDYMAPEQARGAGDVGTAADLFALGCVFYACLTGRPPFAADHLVATLARILFEAHAPLTAVRPDLPASVSVVIDRLLEKRPADRYPDVAALLHDLDALGPLGEAPATLNPARGLSGAELELVSVLLLGPFAAHELHAHTDRDTFTDEDAPPADESPLARLLRDLAARGATAERLADGSIVATFAQRSGAAVDQAVQAAECARIACSRWPSIGAVVATARQVSGAGLPIGDALERAAMLRARGGTGTVWLDDVTAALVDGRMRTTLSDAGLHTLVRASVTLDESRPLLGRPTPCVGREQELGILEMTLSAALDEESARAVLVIGPAGIGKSRVRHELLRRVARRAEEGAAVLVLEGRGELLRAGSPFGVVADVLRRAFRVSPEGEPTAARARIVAAVAEVGLDEEVAELLGELCDVRFPDEGSVRLRAARQDPKVMLARLSEAFVRWLRALTLPGGLVLVLEDLHWGDRASVDLLGVALRELAERPFVVVVFARPEVHALTPNLWKDRAVEVPLRRLSRRACEQLVKRVAGDLLDAAAASRVVEQSDGNPLVLEELMRAASSGRADTLPETVVAMLQARISRLGSAERRTLRAASVFGEGFDAAGVGAVLGPAVPAEDIARWLAALVHEEVVEPVRESPGQLRFRHALMRDAAYGLMVDGDRRLGHRLAAEWLGARGADPGLVAEHFLLGSRPEAAAPWFVIAALRAHDRDDFAACERLARRGRDGLSGEPTTPEAGEALGALCVLDSLAAVFRWDWSRAAQMLALAEPWLHEGGRWWTLARRTGVQLAAYRNDPAGLRALVADALRVSPEDAAVLVYTDAILHMASSAIQAGHPALGEALLARAESTAAALWPRYPALLAWKSLIRCTHRRHSDDRLAPQMALLEDALRLYAEAGAPRMMGVLTQDILGEVECRAGALDDGRTRLRASYAAALQLGGGFVVSHARLALANGLAARAEPESLDEADALAGELLATPGISDGYRAMALDVRATVALRRGDDASNQAAAAAAREAISLSSHTPVRRWLMVAHLVEALVRTGRREEGEAAIVAALAEVAAYGGGAGYAELPLRVAAACTAAEADRPARLAAVAAYREAQAAAFTTPEAKARYLAATASG